MISNNIETKIKDFVIKNKCYNKIIIFLTWSIGKKTHKWNYVKIDETKGVSLLGKKIVLSFCIILLSESGLIIKIESQEIGEIKHFW
jgi:hypothetical protein